MVLALLFSSLAAAADPLVLTNGLVEVSISPEVFTVVGMRATGGKEWLTTRTAETGTEDAWVDPGGITTDVLPFVEDAPVRRGPALVTDQSALSLTMEGPMSDKLGLWLRKEVRLAPDSPEVSFTVTALSVKEEPQPVALRNTARLGPPRLSLRIMKSLGSVHPLSGQEKPGVTVVNSMKYWMIPIPPTGKVKQMVLGGFFPEFTLRRGREEWTRRLVSMPADAKQVEQECNFLCVLDTDTASYGVAFQGETGKLSKDAPVSLVETWVVR